MTLAPNNRYVKLAHEYEVYQALESGFGFPKCYSYGPFMFYKYMIQDYLGPSLETLHEFMGRKFTEKTVLMIGGKRLSEFLFETTVAEHDRGSLTNRVHGSTKEIFSADAGSTRIFAF